ncbi:MAG: SMC-Scp complex subunit ScpB [Vicinamibacteria bacterium]|nr:SMC-Scp complex subunit ScpB [Vicinamibacteria bacterium]
MHEDEKDETRPAAEEAADSGEAPAEVAETPAAPDAAEAEAAAAPDAGAEPTVDGGPVETPAEGAEPGVADLDEPEPDPPYEVPAQEVRAILEALIFASPEPITPRQIGQVLGDVPKETWQEQLAALREDYAREGRGLQLVEVAGGWQITTRPECNDRVRELLDPKGASRLSIQALETLAVIAYKQPVTLPEVIELRGVKSGGVVKTLLEKRLIKIVGRKEVVGRPMLYGTTRDFLLQFGLKDLSELPKIEEFADVLGEEVDVVGLKRAIEAPRPVEIPLSEADPTAEAAPAVEGEATLTASDAGAAEVAPEAPEALPDPEEPAPDEPGA